MHQTGHCYKFLIERELESCWLLILRAGCQSFIRVSPEQMLKYLKYWEKHISTAGFFLTIKTESCQTTDAAIFWSGCGN